MFTRVLHGGAVGAAAAVAAGRTRCNGGGADYYGSYKNDRFGGGIGERVGVHEEGKKPLPNGAGVVHVTTIADSHENLRRWATQSNWATATEIHKAVYFTRTTNLTQERVLERIRQHYVSAADAGYTANEPIQAALFRLENRSEFEARCASCGVTQLPSINRGLIPEGSAEYIVDFANKRLGGGWLSYGMAQEEKLFMQRFDYGALAAKSLLDMPDPRRSAGSSAAGVGLASPLSMEPHEAWVLQGGVPFAEVGWYGWTRENAEAKLVLLDPATAPARERCPAPVVVAIDAIKANFEVYQRQHLEMMLAKAFTGLAACSYVAAEKEQEKETAPPPGGGGSAASSAPACTVATGSWGCGAFFNNERVMFVIQTLAANLAGLELKFYVLGDGLSLSPAVSFLETAMTEQWTVARTLDELEQKCASDPGWRSKYKPRRRPEVLSERGRALAVAPAADRPAAASSKY